MALWRFTRQDRTPALLIVLLPFLVALPQLLGLFQANPMLYVGSMTEGLEMGWVRGFPYIDPNGGYTAQALGRRAALEWLQGNVPWWNAYSGVGLPLAAEYQPAAFFPLTLLLLFTKGMAWQQVLLQGISGLGTYALLRQMGLGRFAAGTAGILYAFNGTLAWFSHGPPTALPFLPWMLFGIERAYAKAALGLPQGWRTLAIAMALGLLAGFPETAYLGGLLALAWSVVRGFQLPRGPRLRFARLVVLGGTVGVCIAAPQILAFFQFLPQAYLGGHGEDYAARAALPPAALVPSLIAPYAYGSIFGYTGGKIVLWSIWGGIGGYVTVVLLMLAAYGFAVRRGAIGWLLLAWTLVSLARTFGFDPAITLVNLVPGVSHAAFYRYAPPSWQLACVILAAWGLQDLSQRDSRQRLALGAAAAVFIVAAATGFFFGHRLWPLLNDSVGLRNWAWGSAAWAILMGSVCLWALLRARPRTGATWIAALLVTDAILMFALPTFANPRKGAVNFPAVHFLQLNLGFNRFFTLGPIQPNYGAFFGIASINHNYLPVSRKWVDWIRANLDSAVDPVVFNGNHVRPPAGPSHADELNRNLANYAWVGVKYVVATAGASPFPPEKGIPLAFSNGSIAIYEIPGAKPYFEAISGSCSIAVTSRTVVSLDCREPATLLRRELYYPGWSATVNGNQAPIAEHRQLFQAIEVPAGKSEVRFGYAPPHIGWAWLATLGAALALLLPYARATIGTAQSMGQRIPYSGK